MPAHRANTIWRRRVREAVAARSTIVKDQQIAGPGQAFRNNMRVMVADHLADFAPRFRQSIVRPYAPHDRPRSVNNRDYVRATNARTKSKKITMTMPFSSTPNQPTSGPKMCVCSMPSAPTFSPKPYSG